MKVEKQILKEKAFACGSTLCGVASIDRFTGLPEMTSPQHILPGARSVIVIALKFLQSTVRSTSTVPYTIIRNNLSRKVDEISVALAQFLEDNGYQALPTGAIDPCNYEPSLGKKVGLISLKNAACQAGLGVIGKNTLLITPEYGNMVWLGAVISDIELLPDPLVTESPCNEKCRICIENCPVGALDGSLLMDQKKCWNFAFGEEGGGEWRIKCHRCRTKCPYSTGYALQKCG
jgi:epoxyqueuosine reductase QueG